MCFDNLNDNTDTNNRHYEFDLGGYAPCGCAKQDAEAGRHYGLCEYAPAVRYADRAVYAEPKEGD